MKDNIIVYTSANCPRCVTLKEWLRNKGRPYVEKDLDDLEVMTDLVMRNIVVLSAPALEVKGVVYLNPEFFDSNNRLNGTLDEIVGGVVE